MQNIMNYNHVDHRDQIIVPLLEKEEKLDADCGHIAAGFLLLTLQDHFLPGPAQDDRSAIPGHPRSKLATRCLQPRHCLAMLGRDTQARRGWPKWPAAHY